REEVVGSRVDVRCKFAEFVGCRTEGAIPRLHGEYYEAYIIQQEPHHIVAEAFCPSDSEEWMQDDHRGARVPRYRKSGQNGGERTDLLRHWAPVGHIRPPCEQGCPFEPQLGLFRTFLHGQVVVDAGCGVRDDASHLGYRLLLISEPSGDVQREVITQV